MKIERRDAASPKIEVRNVALPVELRAAGEGDDAPRNRLEGYAAKFNAESHPLSDWMDDSFVEVIRPGAFARTLRERPDIRALYNHDTSIVLGRTKNGSLRLSEDDTGLRFECELPDTQAARDVRSLVDGGYVDGCSFGFLVVEDEVLKRADGSTLRTLVDVELYEISPAVAFPAYEDTEVALRHRARRQGHPAAQPRRDRARRMLTLIDLD
jgi:HK97 family phage prohead protease